MGVIAPTQQHTSPTPSRNSGESRNPDLPRHLPTQIPYFPFRREGGGSSKSIPASRAASRRSSHASHTFDTSSLPSLYPFSNPSALPALNPLAFSSSDPLLECNSDSTPNAPEGSPRNAEKRQYLFFLVRPILAAIFSHDHLTSRSHAKAAARQNPPRLPRPPSGA